MNEQQHSLVVFPIPLEFKFIPNQPLPAKIQLYNPTKYSVAFTTKLNKPDRYYIETKTGHVSPSNTVEVDIHMHALPEAPNDINQDKFTVEFVPVCRDLPYLLIGGLSHLEKVEVGVVLKQEVSDEVEQNFQIFQQLQTTIEIGKNFASQKQQDDSSDSLTINTNNEIGVENVMKMGDQRRRKNQGILRTGSKLFNDILQKDLISGRVFLTFILDHLFPRAVRAYSAQICQILLGLFIVCSAFIYFWWLFVQFNQCQTQIIETSGDPKNAIWCNPRYIDNNERKALSIVGIWEGDLTYNARNAGPWQFKFDSYKADNETFVQNINTLIKDSQIFMNSLKNKTFIETLGAVLFFSKKQYGKSGTVELSADIDLEMVFDNYKYNKFSFISLKKELLENINKNQSSSIGDQQQLPVLDGDCIGELIRRGEQYYCHNLVHEGIPEVTGDTGDLTYIAPPVPYQNVFKEIFFPNITLYSDWAKNIRNTNSIGPKGMHHLAYPEKPFTSQFNIQEVFVLNHCNNDGKQQCKEAMENVLEQGELEDFFYTWIPGLWGVLGSDIYELSQLGYRYGVAKHEVYMHSLDMFGFYVGETQVLPENDGPNKQYALVMVPQLVQFDLQYGEMVCRSCQNSASYKNSTDCQKHLYVILHLYTFPMSEYFKNFSKNNLTAQETIEKFYVTSFIHGLKGWRRLTRFAETFSDDVSEPDSSDNNNNNNNNFVPYNFFYNNRFSSVNNLHCDGSSQWAFNESLKFEIPFTLDTGIKSCEVENCPGWLKSLGDAWANVELAYLVVILILSIIILIILFKMQGGQRDQQEGVVSCKETLINFLDKIIN